MSIDAKIVLEWETLIEARGLRVTNVSAQIASRSYLTTLFSTARRSPQSVPEPSVILVAKLGQILGRTVDEMLGKTAAFQISPDPKYQASLGNHSQKVIDDLAREIARRQKISFERPSVEDVLNWWRQNNGRLEGCGQLEQAFDLIEEPGPDDRKISARQVGSLSLAALHLGPSKERLGKFLDLLPENESRQMVASYRIAAQSQKPTFSDPLRVSVQSVRDEICLETEYIRMQLPVTAADKTRLVISYCF